MSGRPLMLFRTLTKDAQTKLMKAYCPREGDLRELHKQECDCNVMDDSQVIVDQDRGSRGFFICIEHSTNMASDLSLILLWVSACAVLWLHVTRKP